MARTCKHETKIMEWASTDAGTTVAEVAELTGMKPSTAMALLRTWAKRGKLRAEKMPGKGAPKLYRAGT